MKILMLIDSLEVGGAETHVELLCLELAQMKHKIIVASSGGKIQDKLTKRQIRCYSLPTPPKSDKAIKRIDQIYQIIRIKRRIAEIIVKEKPDIVHAHTRKMAFIVHGICQKRKIPFVVTAHAKFDMRFPRGALSKWGDKTIAVSNDICEHLVLNGVPNAKIRVINNGVIFPRQENSSKRQSKEKTNEKQFQNSICQPT